jgi:hypothetical protein
MTTGHSAGRSADWPSRHADALRGDFAHAGLAVDAVAGAAPALALAALPVAARPVRISTRTIHLVAHGTQRKLPNEGGFEDLEIFRGILGNATDAT